MRYFYVDIGGNTKEFKEKLLAKFPNLHVYYMPPLHGMCDLPYREEEADHHVVFKVDGDFKSLFSEFVKELHKEDDKSFFYPMKVNCELDPKEPVPDVSEDERPSVENKFLMREHGWHIHPGTLQAKGLYRGVRNEAKTDDDVTLWATSPKEAAEEVVEIIKRETKC